MGVPIRGEVCVAEARKMQVTPSSLVHCVLENPRTASAEDVSHEKSLGKESRVVASASGRILLGYRVSGTSASCEGFGTQKVPRATSWYDKRLNGYIATL